MLSISAFKDISALVLEKLKDYPRLEIEVKYVENATEAHADLTLQKADLVFMSYDDTLSVALEEGHPDITAVMPIHGGILDLCGRSDSDTPAIMIGKKIGIDTNSGYARALRQYLRASHSLSDDQKFEFIFAGATNLRYGKLLRGEIDATLLNPPYSRARGVKPLYRLQDTFGAYQGVVANTNKSWLDKEDNAGRLIRFARSYYQAVADMRDSPAKAIRDMQRFFKIPEDVARSAYDRLWETDGLSLTPDFDSAALLATKNIFMQDAHLSVNLDDDFVTPLATCCSR